MNPGVIWAAITRHMLALPRPAKRLFALTLDASICVISMSLAFYLRLGEWIPLREEPFIPLLISIALALPLFVSFGLYRAIFRYAGWHSIITVAQAIALYSVPFTFIYTIIGIEGVPRTIGLIQPLLLFLLIGSSRVLARDLLGETYVALWRQQDTPRVLIYGAGSAARQLASAIFSSREMKLVGFIDDSPSLWRSVMNGVPISSPDKLPMLAAKHHVSDILLAIPSASRARRAEIVHHLREIGLHVRTLPAVLDLARGSVSVSDLKEVEIEDLLGRSPVPPDPLLISKNIEDKVVLVTGAGGSIGSELCRQIIMLRPKLLLLVDVTEYSLYEIHHSLVDMADQLDDPRIDRSMLLPLLASVTDARRMEEIITSWRPESIYHAAAYKHVPLVEQNVTSGISNNVMGTLVVAKLAATHGVSHFTLISTDKAVRPTNIMGTSKRFAEMILQAMQADYPNTCFSMVRFGNVLGSSGSVVPLFRSQISAGGPITITHADITRYFMTIPEAAQLVLQASAMALGGDLFLLEMGDPVRIYDLARNMIELSGLTVRDGVHPNGDIEIKVVGLRPGEKLFEELLIDDNATGSGHPRILRSKERHLSWPELQEYIQKLEVALAKGDAASARDVIQIVVPEYSPNSALADLVARVRSREDTK